MTIVNFQEVEAFYNPRIARFQELHNHLKKELEQAYAELERTPILAQSLKQRIEELEEQIQGVQERIMVLEKLKKEKLSE